jgi:hypothetical protein
LDFQTTSIIGMVYTKVVSLNVIYNFIVDNIFVKDHLEAQKFIFTFLDFEIKILNILNDLKQCSTRSKTLLLNFCEAHMPYMCHISQNHSELF